jgi:protein phosphatase
VAVAALVVLVAGSVGTYAWALGHWFVGVDSSGAAEEVAVFRGLNVSVIGFDLYELEKDTGLVVADLNQGARNRVKGGITADDPDDADRILDLLRGERLPPCPAPENTSTDSTADATPSRSATRVPGPGPGTGAATTFPGPNGPVTASPPARTSTAATPTTAAPRTTAPPTSAPTTTEAPATSPSLEPGKSCREGD